jgi:hypothetical protein
MEIVIYLLIGLPTYLLIIWLNRWLLLDSVLKPSGNPDGAENPLSLIAIFSGFWPIILALLIIGPAWAAVEWLWNPSSRHRPLREVLRHEFMR